METKDEDTREKIKAKFADGVGKYDAIACHDGRKKKLVGYLTVVFGICTQSTELVA